MSEDAKTNQILRLIRNRLKEENKTLEAAFKGATDELEWLRTKGKEARVPSVEDLTRRVGNVRTTLARIELLRELEEEISD